MANFGNSLIWLVVAFVVTFALNATVNYFSDARGEITISDPLRVDKSDFVLIDISNHGKDFIDGVSLKIPMTVEADSVSASESLSISIERSSAAVDSKLLTINKIPPNRVTKMIVRIGQEDRGFAITSLNASAVGLSEEKISGLESPFVRALREALIYSLIIAIAYWFVYLFLKKETDVFKDRLSKAEAKTERIYKELAEIKERAAKARLLLTARLHDYAKELSFWRNAFKGIAAKQGGSVHDSDAVISEVTKQLKTFGSEEKYFDFEAIEIAARWISEEKKSENR